MSDSIDLKAMSRRGALSLFATASALSLAVPAMLLGASESEAQTAGMERRQDRREGRRDRREDRRDNRQDRRDARRGKTTTTTTGSKQ
jgi:hypothetical protein